MLAWLTAIAHRYGAKILAAAGALAAAVAVLAGARRAGRDAERAESYQRHIDQMKEARDVEAKIRASGPAVARDRLRERQAPPRKL